MCCKKAIELDETLQGDVLLIKDDYAVEFHKGYL